MLASPFPVKQRSENSLLTPRGKHGIASPSAGGTAPVLFGVKVTNQKGRAAEANLQEKAAEENGRSASPASQGFSAHDLQQADAVWRLLRDYNSSTHGSMQRAFRSVDKDGCDPQA